MAATNQVKMKCRDCSLHFILMTDNPDWLEDHRMAYCPECGSTGAKLTWKQSVDGFIFQHVPGDAELVGWLPS